MDGLINLIYLIPICLDSLIKSIGCKIHGRPDIVPKTIFKIKKEKEKNTKN